MPDVFLGDSLSEKEGCDVDATLIGEIIVEPIRDTASGPTDPALERSFDSRAAKWRTAYQQQQEEAESAVPKLQSGNSDQDQPERHQERSRGQTVDHRSYLNGVSDITHGGEVK